MHFPHLSRIVNHLDLSAIAASALLHVEFADQDLARMHDLIDRRDTLTQNYEAGFFLP